MDTGNSIEFIYDLDYSNEICETTFCLDEVIQKEVWGKVSFEPGTDNSVQIQLGNAIWPQSMLLQIGEGEGNFVIKEINYYWKNKLVYSINENELYDLANSERNYQIQMVWDDVDKYVTYFFLEDLADTNYKRIYFNENVLGHIYEQMDKILLIQIIGLFFITFSIAFILLKNMVPLLTSFAKYVSKLYFWSEKGKNVKKTYEELYFLRGLAIIGVVVCHQINFLHVSNWINCITIYSVSMLIFCAGITKSFSINNYVKKKNMSGEKYVWMSYTCNSLKSSVVSYSFCCIIYGIYYKLWNGYSFHELIVSIVEFGLSGPFYFMRYYIVLAVLAPMLYVMIRMVGKLGGGKKIFGSVGLIIVLWIIGYIFRVSFSALGCSYLSIYGLGMLAGIYYENLVQWISRGKWIVLICWLISLGLACNTFWAVANENITAIIGIDSFIEYTINPPNFGVALYAIMAAALFGYLYGYTALKKLKLCKVIKTLGQYSLDIYLWHILIQNLCVRLNSVMHLNIWLLRIIAYTAMFSAPIAGRYLYETIKKKSVLILQED